MAKAGAFNNVRRSVLRCRDRPRFLGRSFRVAGRGPAWAVRLQKNYGKHRLIPDSTVRQRRTRGHGDGAGPVCVYASDLREAGIEMQSAYDLKERAATETPLLLFDCELRDGRTERWSTHKVRLDGSEYEPRVIRHTLFEVQTSSDQGVDAIPRVSIVLANADSYLSQLERNVGLKGARIGVRFLFYDLRNGAAVTNSIVLFQGLANPPDEITEATLRLSALNRMNLQ